MARFSARIPDSLLTHRAWPRRFTLGELYDAFHYATRALAWLVANRVRGLVPAAFVERLMLAVTGVNGCAACSWAHTQMALAQGLSNEEITAFLAGDERFVAASEATAIVFAQHFADARGHPGREAFEALEREYGPARARVILSAAQVMHAANVHGLGFSAWVSRWRGRPYEDSSAGLEWAIMLAGVVFVPFAALHALVDWLARRPNVRFGEAR